MSDKTNLICGHCDSIVGIPVERLGDRPRCPQCKQPLIGGKPATLTTANFAKHLGRNDLPLVVDFWAPWCGPCLAMAPHFDKTAAELDGRLRFAKLNTQDEPGPAAQFGIRSIPTMIVFRNGQPAARQSGAVESAGLKHWLESTLSASRS